MFSWLAIRLKASVSLLCMLDQYEKHDKNDVIAGHMVGKHNRDDFTCPPDSEG